MTLGLLPRSCSRYALQHTNIDSLRAKLAPPTNLSEYLRHDLGHVRGTPRSTFLFIGNWGFPARLRGRAVGRCSNTRYTRNIPPKGCNQVSRPNVPRATNLALLFLHSLQHLQHLNPTRGFFPRGSLSRGEQTCIIHPTKLREPTSQGSNMMPTRSALLRNSCPCADSDCT